MIRFEKQAEADMKGIGERGFPYEICGLMLGKSSPERLVTEVFECGNLNKLKPETRYDMDPKDYLKGETLARQKGLDVLGIFHSHPDHPDKASETDRQAAWPGFSYVIMSIQKGKFASMRSWVLDEASQFQEEEISKTV
ncbi:MAG TPA: M67 family metallopeptidase [bacterium]|nr:M67 family metallopeptidase [bacterium]